MFSRKECEFPHCERRRYKRDMAKVKSYYSGFEGGWYVMWVCREHLSPGVLR